MKRQFVVLLGSRGFAAVMQAVLFGLLARSVTASTFGLVTAFTGVVGVLLVLTGAGMAGVISRAHAQADHDAVASAIRLTVWSGFITAFAITLFVVAWSLAVGGVPLAIALIAMALVIERTSDAALNVPIADGQVTLSTWPILLRRVVAVVLLVVGLTAGFDPIWSYAVATFFGAVSAQWLTRRIVRHPERGTVAARALIRDGSPYMWTTLSGQVRMLDTALVAAVVGPAAAGGYAAASKLVQPALLVPQTIASLVLPRSARLDATDSRRLVRPLVLACATSFVVVLPLMIFAGPLLTLVMGQDYASSAPILRWLLVGMPFFALTVPLLALLQGQGRARLGAVSSVVFAVLLLVDIVVGALLGGSVGAAIGLSSTFALQAVVLVVTVRLTLGAEPRATQSASATSAGAVDATG
ncbi:oligosaccharide flippase family protein [Cellulomonas sp. URHD0024]|uniref:oligosaccharide flippase family protein n=1 Tax=Cellulomonas sp. URHD0024 TaxID=1302620 RepID=UPI0004093D48|nr:oligosaccharide flippase family protein [Cellulomonas sp. URHD0024]